MLGLLRNHQVIYESPDSLRMCKNVIYPTHKTLTDLYMRTADKAYMQIPCKYYLSNFRSISRSVVDTTLEDKTKELMEESRMLLVQFSIDKVSLGVHSMGKTNFLHE